MSEFIFDLQRFNGPGGGGGSSGSSSGSSGGTGASSGGSNAKTDSDSTVAEAAIWKDGWKAYSTKERTAFATAAYALRNTTAPNEYVATDAADVFFVSGLVNNNIYGVDRFDSINFTDLYLESFAAFEDYTEYSNYVDLIFSSGTVTRLYLSDSALTLEGNQFTPQLKFASGLTEAYSFPSKDADGNSIYPGGWFGSEELSTSTAYWNNYVGCIGTDGVYDILPVSRTTNTFVNASNQDDVWLYDVGSLAEIAVQSGTEGFVPGVDSEGAVENTKRNALNLTFSNGTAALVYYTENDDLPTRDYSPTFYLADGSAYVYNSELGWRTYDQAVADKTAADSATAQAALDKIAFDANFSAVYDTAAEALLTDTEGNLILTMEGETVSYNPYDTRTTFPASRWYSTMIYNTYSTNDIVFNDAVASNIVGIIQEDDSNFDLVFDTGAVTRINYLQVVSPVIHFADGTAYAYNYALKDFVSTQYGLYQNDDGLTVSYDTIADNTLAESADLAVSYYTIDPTTGEITDTSDQPAAVKDEGNVTVDPKNRDFTAQHRNSIDFETLNKNVGYEPIHDDLLVTRGENTFLTKVTANDDIWLLDTTLENITDLDITVNYAISMNFDTGKNLRVQDLSRISPVFHFGDGTSAAYNWFADKWVGVTESTAGVAEQFTLSRYVDAFIRNTEAQDVIYLPDALKTNVARVDSNSYYVSLTFDTGTSIAVRYTDLVSPTFVFADGQTYQYVWTGDSASNEDIYSGDEADVIAETFPLSRFRQGTVYNAGYGDVVNFTDATLANVTAFSATTIGPESGSRSGAETNDIVFVFDTGETATISNYLDNYWPRINFADGTSFAYDYYSGVLGTPYESSSNVAQTFNLSSAVNNVVYNSTAEDTVVFDVPYENVAAYEVLNGNDILVTFNTGAQTAIQFWDNYSPTIQFSDGGNIVYDYTNGWTTTNGERSYSGSSAAETFTLSKNNTNYVTYAAEDDLVYFSDAAWSDVTNYTADVSSVTFTFNTGKTATIEYPNLFTPIFQFADGSAYTYYYSGTWYTDYIADPTVAETISLNHGINNLVYNANAADTVLFDTDSAYSTYYSSTYRGGPYVRYTFDNATDTNNYSTIKYTDVTPVVVWSNGTTDTSYRYHEFDGNINSLTLSKVNDGVVDYVRYANDDDIIAIPDATKAEASLSMDGSDLFVTFANTGKTIRVNCSEDFSPIFQFSDGTIGFDTINETPGTPYEASANMTLSAAADNLVYHAGTTVDMTNLADNGIKYIDFNTVTNTITMPDATKADKNGFSWSATHNYFRFPFTFNGVDYNTSVSYEDNNIVSIELVLTGGESPSTYCYNGYDAAYGVSEYITIDTDEVNVICWGRSDDYVNFADTSTEDVTNFDVTSRRVRFYVNGSTTVVGYYGSTEGLTPALIFSDGTYRYNYNNSTWETTSDGTNWTATSAPFTQTSSDLWGDTFTGTAEADNLFVGTYANTIVQNVDSQDSVTFDAELSDIVATCVEGNTIAVNFATGVTAVIQTAGDSPTFNLVSGESFTYDSQSASWKSA